MSGFTCTQCDGVFEDHDGAMGVVLHGFGDRGLIDTFQEEIEVTLCQVCARGALESTPWMSGAFRALNINYGHACSDGEIRWIPEPACEVDADAHGWREVWVTAPKVPGRVGERAPLTDDAGNLVRFGVFDTREDAEAHAAALTSEGCAVRVARSLSGNEAHHGVTVPWREFWAEWPARNRAWIRQARATRIRRLPRHLMWRAGRIMRSRRTGVR